MPEMTSEELTFPGGCLQLSRPGGGPRTLRAWDAADELLLDYAQRYLADSGKARVLLIDDLFGALTLGLNDFRPVVVADQATLAPALQINASANGLAPPPVRSWLEPPEGPFDLIVMRAPRQADYLRWLLVRANRLLKPGGCLLAGGMIKHLPDQSSRVFAGQVRTLEVSPARKKARVIVCEPDESSAQNGEDWQGYSLDSPGLRLEALPAVFARHKLDIGSRLLLPQIPALVSSLPPGARVLDLGCGNGILGLTALSARGDLQLTFCDVSSHAVLSARRNLQQNHPAAKAEFAHNDGIAEAAGLFDLVLLNPPFHEGGVVGDHVALGLFRQVGRHLSAAGSMLLVGNRHLGYHRSLRRYFTEVRQLDADPKFVVFVAANP